MIRPDSILQGSDLSSAQQHATVRIGGLPVRLKVADSDFRAALLRHYRGFTQPASSLDCHLEIDLASPSSLADPDADVRVERSGATWVIRRGDFEAEWDPASRRGRVRQTPNPYSIDTVLRIIHSLVLAEEGGFLLHSASVVRNQRAFLFSGISGAGKTTISRLAPADTVLLTDEISYVRRQSSAFHACGTPFAGELAQPGEDISAPIGAAYLLVQGLENRVDPVKEADAVRALMRNVLFFASDPLLIQRLFETVCEFVTRVPVLRLTFLPDQRVWELIR